MTKQFKPETEKCPICDTTWTKTSFGANVWYDCKPCNKTAEDIVVLKKSSSSGTKEFRLGELQDWEDFLLEFDLDDDDDFGVPFLKYKTKDEKFDIVQELFEQGIIETAQEYVDWLNGE